MPHSCRPQSENKSNTQTHAIDKNDTTKGNTAGSHTSTHDKNNTAKFSCKLVFIVEQSVVLFTPLTTVLTVYTLSQYAHANGM